MPPPPTPVSLQRTRRRPGSARSNCLPWRGALDAHGYPRAKDGGRAVYAHRVLFERYIRPLQNGERVYRLCGRRDCTNPLHFTTEAPARRWRRPASAKLSRRAAAAIRARWAGPERPTQRELAREHRVSRSAISLVVRGVTWPPRVDGAAGRRRYGAAGPPGTAS